MLSLSMETMSGTEVEFVFRGKYFDFALGESFAVLDFARVASSSDEVKSKSHSEEALLPVERLGASAVRAVGWS